MRGAVAAAAIGPHSQPVALMDRLRMLNFETYNFSVMGQFPRTLDASPRADYYYVAVATFDFSASASLEVDAFKSRVILLILPVNLLLSLA